ncbi:MAG TPA: hypothetical protein VGL86_22975 [Polyangia bacterium]
MQAQDLVPVPLHDVLAEAHRARRAVADAWRPILPWTGDPGEQSELPPLYHVLPFLFLDAFAAAPLPAVGEFAVAVGLLAGGVLAEDALIDGEPPESARAVVVLRASVQLHEAYERLYRLFPAPSPFWAEFRASLTRSVRSFRAESLHRHRWRALDEAGALAISEGKSALAQIVPSGLAVLAGDECWLPRIAQSLADYHLAFQLVDDLVDWRRDALAGAPTFPLVRVYAASDGPLEPDEIGRALYGAGHARATIERALGHLDAAADLPETLPLAGWRRLLALRRGSYERLRDELRR